ncbi:hypothetical protein C0Q70_13252 [Pomacea canaliculata]|uniref:LITAF domain-containing protein n=1 Tax=Pomacea canaliculata TaxID=400727 RepID=A0A2T7NWQ0_POMCA|nr:hypothetical protein C0Q70_13252 [Pomacea canaliculata]
MSQTGASKELPVELGHTAEKSPSSLLCHPYWTLQCGDQREGHDSGSWPMTEHLGGETGDLNKTAVLPNSVGCMWLAWCCWACLACLLLFTRLAWLIAAKERHGTVTGGREADLDCPLCRSNGSIDQANSNGKQRVINLCQQCRQVNLILAPKLQF